MFIQCRDDIRSLKFKEICDVADHLGLMQAMYVNTEGVFVPCNEIRAQGSFM